MYQRIENIEDLCYEAYKANWMQRISWEREVDALLNYYEGFDNGDYTCDEYTFEDYIDEVGYDGELYVCKDEFLGAEFLDEDYINSLIGHNEILMGKYREALEKKREDEYER